MQQSKESAYSKAVRSRVIIVMGLFVLFLGAPLFLHTTRVHRADLPVSLLSERVESSNSDLTLRIPIYINSSKPDIIPSVQKAVDEHIAEATVLGLSWGLDFHPYTPEIDSFKQYVLSVIDSNESKEGDLTQYYVMSPYSKGLTIILSPSMDLASISQYATQVLFEQVFKIEVDLITALQKDTHISDMTFPFSPIYNVVFNLFVQDGSPVEWEIEKAVSKMQPIFQALKHYCKFKVSTQVQYYSKLANNVSYDEELKANVLSQDNLSTFINFGDWNLNSHEKTPSINFLIYFSDLNYDQIPLLVPGSKTNSFSIPQWGGVHIYNPSEPLSEGAVLKISELELQSILDIFASQLFELLGVPGAPASLLMRIDTFQRVACYKNLHRSLDNLNALVKLSNSLTGISIPESTKKNVLDSLLFYDQAVERLHHSDFSEALEKSGKSVESSDKAFFEKEMLQQAHFPNEHKLAVFLPLLGPICSIVLFGMLKRFKVWREERKKASKAELEKKEI